MFTGTSLSLLGLFLVGIQYINGVSAADATCTPSYDSESGVLTIDENCTKGYYLLKKGTVAAVTKSTITQCVNNGGAGGYCTLAICDKADENTPCRVIDADGNFISSLKTGGRLLCTVGNGCYYDSAVTTGTTYYVNDGWDRVEHPLIECAVPTGESAAVCETIAAPSNGYYLDKGTATKIIKCWDGFCESITPPNGYYLNAAETGDDDRMIHVKGGTIDVKDTGSESEETFTVTACSAENSIGKIVKGTEAKNICLSSTKSIDITASTEGYYLIKPTDANIALGGAGTYIVKIGNGAVIIVANTDRGYYQNAGDDKTENPVLQMAASPDSVALGNTFIKSDCKFSIPGGLVKNGNGEVKSFCPGKGATPIDITETTDKYIVLEIPTTNTAYAAAAGTVLVKYGHGAIKVVETTSGDYYVNSGPDSSEKPLIQCGTTCTAITPIYGYYVHGSDDRAKVPFISCGSDGCKDITLANIPPDCSGVGGITGVVQHAGLTYYCPNPSMISAVEVKSNAPVSYYLVDLSRNDAPVFLESKTDFLTSHILVKVEGTTVSIVDGTSGYYLNSGDDNTSYPVIQCIKGRCEKLTTTNFSAVTACTSDANKIIFESPTYKFCLGSTKKQLDAESYEIITVAEETFTPFTGEYKVSENISVIVRISVGAVELVSKDGFYVLSGNELVKCEKGNCSVFSVKGTGLYFLNAGSGDGVIKCEAGVTDCYTSGKSINAGYYFNDGDTTTIISCESATSCEAITPDDGYYLFGTDTIKCDKRKGCSKMTDGSACAGNDGGKLSDTAKNICPGEGTTAFTFKADEDYQLIQIKYTDDFPFTIDGVNVGETTHVLLKTTANSMTIVKSPKTGYYLNKSSSKSLIYCDGECKPAVTISNIGYFLNVGDDADVYPFIYCAGATCTKKDDTKAFVVTTCSHSHLLYKADTGIGSVCISDGASGEVSMTGDTEKFYILSLDNESGTYPLPSNFLSAAVNAGEQSFIVLKVGKMAAVVETAWESNKYKYYLNSGSNATSQPLITCDTSVTTCKTVAGIANSYFINGAAGTSGKPLIYCTSTTSCNPVEAKPTSYYLAGNTGGYKVIKCTDASTCTAIDISTKTNGIVADTNCVSGNIIKSSDPVKLCTKSVLGVEDGDISLESTDGDGYYLITLTGTVENENQSFFTGNGAGPVLIKKENNSVWLVTEAKTYAIPNSSSPTNYVVVEEDKTTYPIKGYYKLGESLLNCDGDKCQAAATKDDCTGVGDLVIKDNKKSLCIDAVKANSIDITGDIAYHQIADIFGETGKQIVKVGGGSALLVSHPVGNYLNGGDTATNIMIGSDIEYVVKDSIVEGYYLNGHDKTLIYCPEDQLATEGSKCIPIEKPGIGYYIKKGETNNIIACKEIDDGVVKCKEEAMADNNCSGGHGKFKKTGTLVCNDDTGKDINGNAEYFYKMESITTGTPFSNPSNKALVRIGKYAAVMVTPSAGYYYVTAATTIMKCTGTTVDDCGESVSPPGVGYYLEKEGETINVVKCTYSGGYSCVLQKTVDEFKAGEILKDTDSKYKYCHKVSSEEIKKEIIATDTGKEYIILTTPTDGQFSDETTANILLKNGNNAIIMTNAPTGGENYKGYYINDDKNQSSSPLIKFEGASASGGSFTMVSTVSNGYYLSALGGNNIIICQNSSCELKDGGKGYYINEGDKTTNKIIRCNGTSCVGITTAVAVDTEDVKNAAVCAEGYLLKGTTNFCLGSSGTGMDISTAEEALYLVKGVASTAYGVNTNILLRTGNKAIILQESAKGYYLNGGADKDTNPIIKYTTDYSRISASQILGRSCSESDTNSFVGGLIMDDNNNYYVCTERTDESRLQIKSETTTTFHPILKLSASSIFATAANQNVLVRKGSQFINLVGDSASELVETNKLYVDSSSLQIVEKAKYTECTTDKSVIRYTITIASNLIGDSKPCDTYCNLEDLAHPSGCKKGYYLANQTDREIVTTADEVGDLYKCEEENKCKKLEGTDIPIGYLLNNGMDETTSLPYILCSFDSIGNHECKLPTIGLTESCEAEYGIGSIYTKNDADGNPIYKICLTVEAAAGDKGITADPEAQVSYFVDMSKKNKFTQGRILSYGIVDFNNGNVTVRKDKANEAQPKYQYTDANHKIEASNVVVDAQNNKVVCDYKIFEFEWIAGEAEKEGDTEIINYYSINDKQEPSA